MANRFVLKQFAGSATNNGAFGAAQATGAGVQPVANIEDVQSLAAFEQGWNSATLTADKLPPLEEMQGLEALLCKALKENYSEGIPFWIAGETYFQYSFVNYNGVLYYNTTGSYTNNNPAIDTANWAAYDKVGTATVGTDDTPIYLNVGTPTAGKRMGVVAYDNTKTYNLDDVVLNVDSTGTVVLYLSLDANNTSALTDTTKWEKISLGGNTPFFFGQSQYFENAPYNASWLASNGQYNSSGVYPDFWTQLTGVELNGSLNVGDTIEISGKTYVKRGLPVVLSTGTITDYDFVVNKNDQTFRLPLLNGEEDLSGSTYELISSSSIDYTLPKNGTVRVRGESASNSRAIVWAYNTSTSDADHAYSAGTLIMASAKGKKGDLVHVLSDNCINVTVYFTPAVGNGTLYYYVGDTVQDASLINAGAVLGQLANKADIDLSNLTNGLANTICTTPATTTSTASSARPAVVVENYYDSTTVNWYRVWSDGWVEQGGMIYYGDGTGSRTVNFLKPFNMNGNPNIQITICGSTFNSPAALQNTCNAQTRSDTGFTTYVDANAPIKFWVACGKGA